MLPRRILASHFNCFDELLVKQGGTESGAKANIADCLSLLDSYMGILEQSLRKNLMLQIEIEVGTALISQAEMFLLQSHQAYPQQQKIKASHAVASVVLVSAVIERIVHILGREKLVSPSKLHTTSDFEHLNRLINSLEDVNAIDSAIAQKICFCLSLREKVILNQAEQLGLADIKRMIEDTRILLETMIKPELT